MRAKILVSLMFFSLLIPAVSLAASTELAPEFNPLCWHLKECNETRAGILAKEVKDIKPNDTSGWFKEDPCNQEGWGKCLPSGITVTEISFGGKNQFANLGDFLKTNYNLAITIAGILAVMMIIIAGVQWITSGGNSEMITSAKKRIGGALTGLLIAYLSYTILNTINPALVDLRLPQNFLIRPFKISPQNCRDASEGTKFALAAKKGEKVDSKKMQDPKLVMETLAQNKMACGDNFFLEGGGGATCMGSACNIKGETCLPFTTNGNTLVNNTPNCEAAQLAVHYSIEPDAMHFFQTKVPFGKSIAEQGDWIDHDTFVSFPVCKTKVSGQYYICMDEHGKGIGINGVNIHPKKFIAIPKTPFWEYYVLFDGFVAPATGEKQEYLPGEYGSIYNGDRLVGFILRHETGSNWALGDDWTYSSDKKVGTFKSISESGFISAEQIAGGKSLNAVLSTGNLQDIDENDRTKPTTGFWDGAVSGGVIDYAPVGGVPAGYGATGEVPGGPSAGKKGSI